MKVLSILISAIWICCLTGCTSQAEHSQQDALPVQTAVARRDVISNVLELTGIVTAEPNRSARVTSVAPGVLDFVGPRVGDSVKKDEVVATLQNSLQSAQLKQNRASWSMANANLQKAKNGLRSQEIDQARAAYDAAKANLQNATQNRTRLQKLFEEQVSAGRDYDLAVGQERVAIAQLHSAQAALTMALKGPRKEDRDAAAAQAEQAAALVDQANANLNFTRLRSPIKGVVAERYLDVGEQAGPTTPVLLIVDPSVVNVQVSLPVGYNDKVYEGQSVQLQLPDDSMTVPAKVSRVGVKLDPLTNSVPVQVVATNLDMRLKIGMVVKARITTGQHDALVVPKSALIGSADDPSHRAVNLLVNGASKGVPVETGINNGDLVEIKSGLRPGDVVITSVGYRLPDGTKVRGQ